MKMHVALATGILASGMVLAALPSIAATSPLSTLKGLGAAQSSNIEQAAWWTHRCHWGIGGYHKWVPGVGRVQCTAKKCWTNSFGIRRCRWF